MYADDYKSLICIFLMPLLHVGLDISAVVAAESPELDHHHFAPQVGQVQGRAVQPSFVRNVRRLHADSRIGHKPSDEHPDQEHIDADQHSPYHGPLPAYTRLHYNTVLDQSWIYLAIVIAGVGYLVRSVTVI